MPWLLTSNRQFKSVTPQIQQEWQSLKNFVHQEYDKIWHTGRTGIKNKAIDAKKRVYGEKLNQYINARITYEETIHNLSEELKEKLDSLKQQNPPALINHIKGVKALHNQQVTIETCDFNEKFYRLIDDEQERLLKIKMQYEKEKKAYQQAKQPKKKKAGK